MMKKFLGLKRYISSDDLLYFKLLKALYGCVQANRVWFEKHTMVLRHEGYEHSPTDPCEMRQIVRDKIFLLSIYMDDILIFADEMEHKCIETFFKAEFTWIMMNIENVLLEPGVVTVDMSYYLEKLLKGYDNLPLCSMPGKNVFFCGR